MLGGCTLDADPLFNLQPGAAELVNGALAEGRRAASLGRTMQCCCERVVASLTLRLRFFVCLVGKWPF